ncbi:MAG: prepilin-type N-terminal cleavage/methylation domain-containing protein [Verrucomicrobia bacterium]|nr:prepilin-type N-terminal cleavage/methylation domain-containing protein [Verrucomicrobiota bacterium]
MTALRTIRRPAGFTFIEALMTIAIMAMMATLVISAFSNAGTDSARIVSRQQQATLQSALNAWVNGESNRTDVISATLGTGRPRTIAQIQTAYNAVTGNLARFNLISPYLDSNTTSYFTTYSSSTQILSDALNTTKQYIAFPDWAANSYPQVTLNAK